MSATESHDRHGLVVLTREECMKLLGDAVVGRIGITVDALPAILPVNFALLDDNVVIRTGWGEKLRSATERQVVCFQVDEFEPAAREGWSVLVTGRAFPIEDPGQLDRAHSLALEPWGSAAFGQYVMIRSELVSGRRLRPPEAVPTRQ